MTRPRLMIVEDDAVVSMDLQRRLRKLGYEVLACARTGKEALERARQLKPNMVLMDITLEGEMDGIATAREIATGLRIPSVFLTAHTDTLTLNRVKETGAAGYLVKPVRDRELVAAVELAASSILQRGWGWMDMEQILSRMTDAAIAVHGPDHTIFYANAIALQTLQGSLPDLAGRRLNDVVVVREPASGCAPEWDRWLADLAASGSFLPVYLLAEGRGERPIELSAVRFGGREDICHVILFRQAGIHNEQAGIETCTKDGSRVADCLGASGIGVWWWDPAGAFRWSMTDRNSAISTIESSSLAAFARIIPAEERPQFVGSFATARETGGSVNVRTRMMTAKGIRWAVFEGGPAPGPGYAGTWKFTPEIQEERRQLMILSRALDRVTQGITVADADGRIVYVNRAEAQMHGYLPDELIGRPAAILGWEELRRPSGCATSRVWRRETANQKKDGTVFRVMLTTEQICDENEAPLFQLTTSELINEERTGAGEPEAFSFALEQAAAAILITDAQGNIQHANQSFCEMAGYGPEEFIGRKPSIFKSGMHTDCFYRELWSTILSGRPWRGVLVNKRKNGELYHNECEISPLVSHDGVITHFISTGRDITEELQLRERVKRKESFELMGRLVGGVAHEVRNPLNVIQATLEALSPEEMANEECAASWKTIHEQVQRLSNLMKDLLQLGKPLQESRLQTEDIPMFCRTTISSVQKQFPEHTFALRALGAEGPFARIDPAGLYQVLQNLLENAAQHSPPGQAIEVEVLRENESNLIVRVRDSGRGIVPDDLAKLFEPFFTTRRGGTGLGLSIVRHIVEAHGGYVTAQNNTPEPGAAFEVHLPATESV